MKQIKTYDLLEEDILGFSVIANKNIDIQEANPEINELFDTSREV